MPLLLFSHAFVYLQEHETEDLPNTLCPTPTPCLNLPTTSWTTVKPDPASRLAARILDGDALEIPVL